MEKLLHYIWKHRILPLKDLTTTSGHRLEVIDPGTANHNAGPDFFNAKVRIDGTVWAGNVEIHLCSSDWFRHGHDSDAAYDNTILHVAQTVDCDVRTQDGKTPPQLQLLIPQDIRDHYRELLTTDDYPRCYRIIPNIERLKIHMWMDALLCQRLQERSALVLKRLELTGGDWEAALFITLSRNMGFGLNGDAFEQWARMVPLTAIGKHRDDAFQIEAMFVGLAGLLDAAADERLSREYAYLSHKFSLPQPLQHKLWRYLRTRPQNFPHVRLHQLALLYHAQRMCVSSVLEAETLGDYDQLLAPSGMSAASRQLVVINTIVPFLYAYGTKHQEPLFQERAVRLLEGMKAEKNHILRQWQACGLNVDSAADSQALIQLKREYCDKKDCLRCRFGYEFLSHAASK